jgi:phosphohistidine phosphatase SixA
VTVVLVRHASAGKRERWAGDDRMRPLDERGWQQAEEIAASLVFDGLERILSSPFVRCIQTVELLAQRVDLEIEKRVELAEGASRAEGLALLDELGGAGAVLCTHGDVAVELLGVELKKGATAVLKL